MKTQTSNATHLLLNLMSAAFFVWVVIHYALGGWESGWFLVSHIGWPAWIGLGAVTALVIYKIDFGIDLPLFAAAFGLGYWGEWWGTTRGVWTYWNHQAPPDYMPFLWAVGLLTVYHLQLCLLKVLPKPASRSWRRLVKYSAFAVLPAAAFAYSAPILVTVDWTGRLDLHLAAGVAVGIALVAYRFKLDDDLILYVCGMLLGGTYEWLGTWMKEWTYITREVPPIWIIPLWGLACVAMVHLSRLLTLVLRRGSDRLRGLSLALVARFPRRA